MKKTQAFPSTETNWYDEKQTGEIYHPGMSLRDYFAGQVLSGISNESLAKHSWEHVAKWAYAMADAMLKARGDE
jgi:hypothetical protein